jgi:hypothetical protein
MLKHRGTAYQFAHHRTVAGERCLIWGNGIGEVLIPVASPEYFEALNDRGLQLNDLVNEGEQEILETYFRSTTKQTTLYGRLFAGTAPAEDATLAAPGSGRTEVTGTGYAPNTQCNWNVGNTDFPTSALTVAGPTGDWRVTSSVKTFTAGAGGWSAATQLFLATVATGTAGKFLAWTALSATRTLASTDTLDVSVSITLA